MEKLIIPLINIFLSVFFTMLIFCALLNLEFSIIKVIILTGFLYLICGFWKPEK